MPDAAAGAQPEGERKLDHYIIAMKNTDVPPPVCHWRSDLAWRSHWLMTA